MHIRGIFVHIQRTAILVNAVLKVCILMGLMFHKCSTNRHNLLRTETRLSPSTYYFRKIYQRNSILMGHLHIYSYKKEGLYLYSDIRSRGAKKYSPSFLTKLQIRNRAPSIYKHTHRQLSQNSKKTHLRRTQGALFITTVLNHKREGTQDCG